MRDSVSYRPTNQYVISAQLDKESHEALDRLCKESGLSRSRMIRLLITGAKVRKPTVSIVDGNSGETIRKLPR